MEKIDFKMEFRGVTIEHARSLLQEISQITKVLKKRELLARGD